MMLALRSLHEINRERSYLVLFHVLSGEAFKINLCTVGLLKCKITDFKFLSVTISCFLHILLAALSPDHDPLIATVSIFAFKVQEVYTSKLNDTPQESHLCFIRGRSVY